MTFPTQLQPIIASPFKDAWYHDFAPPIHSLDRHGDFAPPLLALGMDTGFFLSNVDDDDCAIRFNYLNGLPTNSCHGWLYARAIAADPTTGHNMDFISDGHYEVDATGNLKLYSFDDFRAQLVAYFTPGISQHFGGVFADGATATLVASTTLTNFAEVVTDSSTPQVRINATDGLGGGDVAIDGGTIEIRSHTGATKVSILTSGSTFEVRDHNDVSLVVYTG